MSQENVEVVRSLAEAWRVSDRDAWMAAWDEDAEFYPLRSQLKGHGYHGRAGLREVWAAWDSEWEWVHYLVDEILDAGDQVVALAHFKALGQVSGVELDYPTPGSAGTSSTGHLGLVSSIATTGITSRAATSTGHGSAAGFAQSARPRRLLRRGRASASRANPRPNPRAAPGLP